MHLFRGIDEKKKECECARGDSCEGGGELRCAVDELIKGWRARFSTAPRPRVSSQSIHNMECFITLETLNYAAERCAKTPDIFVKWKIFRTDFVFGFCYAGGFSHRR